MKRFYRDADVEQVEGGWQVALDGRLVKTQFGAPQVTLTEDLARLLASEWAGLGEEFAAQDLPLRNLADRAIDLVAPARSDTIAAMLKYADTDTLCYRAEPDEPLFHRQREMWDPILASFEAREGISLQRVHGIVHRPQSPESMRRIKDRLEAENHFALAALSEMASLAASLCVAFEALEHSADGEMLWNAANLEEDWQVELWGEDAQAAARRARRRSEFLKALEFARAARA